jgi:hypothetical protein
MATMTKISPVLGVHLSKEAKDGGAYLPWLQHALKGRMYRARVFKLETFVVADILLDIGYDDRSCSVTLDIALSSRGPNHE